MTSLHVEATPPSIGKGLTRSLAVNQLNQLLEDSQRGEADRSKPEIRRSLKASTLDGAFSSAFESIVKGVLISNFLLGLGAGALEVGLLTSIPMMAHLLQPLGAYFSEKATSRHLYCLWIFGIARLVWLLPAAGIFGFSHGHLTAHELTVLTMAVLALSTVLEAIGCAAWMSWMAVLVPVKLRGRYFSLRRSLSSISALLTIPAGGWLVSHWLGSEVEGYGIVLVLAVAIGLVSLGFQFQMSDVNPQQVENRPTDSKSVVSTAVEKPSADGSGQALSTLRIGGVTGDGNFLTLLLFLGLWSFGVNLSAPFFNFYLLDTLNLNVQWVTLYSGLIYGAFFLMIMLWGRLADRIGNRPVLIVNCVLAAALPLLWLYTDSGIVSVCLGLPVLHLMQGSTFAALDLCLANIQMELAPLSRQSSYFAIAAAVMGITGAAGATSGSFLAASSTFGLPFLFALSAIVRLVGITPLVFVTETRAQPIRLLIAQQRDRIFQRWPQPVRIKA
ncbi:MAG: MFS transporter [Phormidesmis sp.]